MINFYLHRLSKGFGKGPIHKFSGTGDNSHSKYHRSSSGPEPCLWAQQSPTRGWNSRFRKCRYSWSIRKSRWNKPWAIPQGWNTTWDQPEFPGWWTRASALFRKSGWRTLASRTQLFSSRRGRKSRCTNREQLLGLPWGSEQQTQGFPGATCCRLPGSPESWPFQCRAGEPGDTEEATGGARWECPLTCPVLYWLLCYRQHSIGVVPLSLGLLQGHLKKYGWVGIRMRFLLS